MLAPHDPAAEFVVTPLAVVAAGAAYPLMREAVPGLDLRAWRRFVRRAASPRQAGRLGILTASRPARRFPCGLLCYHRIADPSLGDMIVASHFAALDPLGCGPVFHALEEALAEIARASGCQAIRAFVPPGESGLIADLLASGHLREGEAFLRKVGG